MAETDIHRKLMMYAIDALTRRYRDQPLVYVAGNNFIYYAEGDNKKFVSPGTYLVFGAPKGDRRRYKVWEEGGKGPDVVIEFTPRSTRWEDRHKKRPLYEQVLRVKEYFLFDPTGDYLRPALQGYVLEGSAYRGLELAGNRLKSELLGLELEQEGQWLRLWDSETGEYLPTTPELGDLLDAERERSEREAAARAEAEAEVARLREALAQLRTPASSPI